MARSVRLFALLACGFVAQTAQAELLGQMNCGPTLVDGYQVHFVAFDYCGPFNNSSIDVEIQRWKRWVLCRSRSHTSEYRGRFRYHKIGGTSRKIVLLYVNRTTGDFQWIAVNKSNSWQVLDSNGDMHVLRNKHYHNHTMPVGSKTVTLVFHNPRNEGCLTGNHVGYKFYFR